ncbi:hypothetical protein [Limoniibacter endophyticus]|uniref:DUF4239 domain-containing protein n=1 Tax=Limoniibacter endophyticus TaxID=1565040 RepID=A0A8J3DR15_9HYPH|nr:hypothetical protein [Limoniibacter endophyticus]GHC75433.1 hypothetical protein GCM10010136_25340 [Limoniibacter endophyticus]
MTDLALAFMIFAWLAGAAVTAMHFFPKLPQKHRDEETTATVRLVANLFVVMTSLVFGLMINSSKSTFEVINSNVHQYATNLIILDRTLRHSGPTADEARTQLRGYVEMAIENPLRAAHTGLGPDPAGEELDKLGDEISSIISPSTFPHLLEEARQQYRQIVQLRWALVEQSEGRIPLALIAMLVAWLTLIFISYGYRAPHNAMVISAVAASALVLATSLHLILDMDKPFAGLIQVMDDPLRRALAEIRSTS